MKREKERAVNAVKIIYVKKVSTKKMIWEVFKLSVGYVITFIFLLVCTVFDVKMQKIPLAAILLYIIYAAIHHGNNGTLHADIICRDITPGILVLAIGYATKGKIGYGDGLMVMSIGFLVGLQINILILTLSIMLSGIYAFVKIVLFHCKKEEKMAFAPFLLSAWGVFMIGG